MRLPGLVEVTSGVKDGDEVITAGLQKIGDGAPVAPKPAEGAAPAASAAKPAQGSAQ